MKVATIGHGLDGGGAEKQLLLLERFLETELELCSVRILSGNEVIAGNHKVLVFREARTAFSKILNNIKFVFELRQTLYQEKVDHVISYTTRVNIYSILACLFSRRKIIVSERNILSNPRLGLIWKIFRFFLYPLANTLVLQTENELTYSSFQTPFCRKTIIPNMISPGEIAPVSAEDVLRIVFVGRKIYQKGFDLGVEAISKLPDLGGKLEVVFIGLQHPGESGYLDDFNALKHTINRYGLTERVQFTPWLSRGKIFRDGDVFVLSSRYEGFPNILLEALSAGVPCVSFDGPAKGDALGVASEHISIAQYKNTSDLALMLDKVIKDGSLRKENSAQGREAVISYAPERIGKKWLEAIVSNGV